MIYIKQHDKDDEGSRIRILCIAILKQAIVDWRYDVARLKGVVDGQELTLSQHNALKDMLNTIEYIEGGYTASTIGVDKHIIKRKFLQITPKENVEWVCRR